MQRIKSRGGQSPRRNGAAPPQGSGPGGLITPDDIRAKAEELVSGVEGQVQTARPTADLRGRWGLLPDRDHRLPTGEAEWEVPLHVGRNPS